MNPVFWFLVLLSCVCLWFLLRVTFIATGAAVYDLLRDTKDILNSDEKENKHNGGNENA